MPSKIEISHKTIIFTIIFLLSLWFLFQVRQIIYWVFVSFIMMSAIKPLADLSEKKGLPRSLSVILIYILLIIFFSFAGSSIIPPMVSESVRFAESLPGYLHTVLPFLTIDSQFITQQITPVSQNVVQVTVGLFSNIIALFTILIISFYMVIERKYLDSHLASFMGKDGAEKVIRIMTIIETRLGLWVRGQMLLAFIIGLGTFIGLTLLGIPFALPLSLLAGILEIIPIIGPIIAAIPAILIAFTISSFLGVATLAFYFLLQQIEANVIVPVIIKRAVGLPPLVTILALMIGSEIAGITGALLSVPLVVAVATSVSEYFKIQLESAEAHKPDSV